MRHFRWFLRYWFLVFLLGLQLLLRLIGCNNIDFGVFKLLSDRFYFKYCRSNSFDSLNWLRLYLTQNFIHSFLFHELIQKLLLLQLFSSIPIFICLFTNIRLVYTLFLYNYRLWLISIIVLELTFNINCIQRLLLISFFSLLII